MPTVDYPFSADYLPLQSVGLVPALEVELVYAGHSTKAVGVVDSGSTLTFFNPEHASLIGIDDVTGGQRGRVSTQAGSVVYFIFELEMLLRIGSHENRFPCRVGFFDVKRPRNILGRDYIFRHYEIGFRDMQQVMHFRPE